MYLRVFTCAYVSFLDNNKLVFFRDDCLDSRQFSDYSRCSCLLSGFFNLFIKLIVSVFVWLRMRSKAYRLLLYSHSSLLHCFKMATFCPLSQHIFLFLDASLHEGLSVGRSVPPRYLFNKFSWWMRSKVYRLSLYSRSSLLHYFKIANFTPVWKHFFVLNKFSCSSRNH